MTEESDKKEYKSEIVWRNVTAMTFLHVLGACGWYYGLMYGKIQSFFFAYFIGIISAFGVLAGAHRLWSHRAYKAHWSLRFFLMILQTMALQNDIYEWCRDHRVHHKFAETDADPHNSKRGFFFAHMGWLLIRKHPQVKEKGRTIDLSDLWEDPIVRFQRRFYIPLVILIWGILPIIVPYYLWDEPLWLCLMGNCFRYVLTLHQAWLVNSAAHIYGQRPYNKSIEPRENKMVSYLTMGEGYHNYHHTFPWDYSASEYGWSGHFNPTTGLIDMFAALGLAYDLKVAPDSVVEKSRQRTGKDIDKPQIKNKFGDSIIGIIYITWPLWTAFFIKSTLL